MNGSDSGGTQALGDLTIEGGSPDVASAGRAREGFDVALPLAAAALVMGLVGWIWFQRAPYPFDLEWMEGGMLAHAWRVSRFMPLYVEPGPEFVPFVYPPGYPTVLAALGWVVGLTPLLGRLVSIAGTLAAAAAVGFVVVRYGGSRVVALVAAVVFVGTYPATGAFFDLVRPDGLMMGLLAWSVALALERHPRAPVVAGALLVLAFLCKHNAAAFGVPMALGIALRDGRWALGRFLLASVVPALVAVGWLQFRSDGRFLVYLLEVPASHAWVTGRIWPLTFQEVGSALPVALAAITGTAMWLGVSGQRVLPLPVTTFGPVGVGMAVAAMGTYVPPRGAGLYNIPAGVAFFALGAIPTAIALFGVGRVGERVRAGVGRPVVSARGVHGIALCLTALAMSAAMRAHDGGFLNVHIPLFWATCVAFGVVLSWLRRRWPSDRMRALVVVTATAQLSWSLAMIDRSRLVPTDADRALGERLIAAARSAEGEVLSPFAAWIPVYAGKPPSLHYMGLWDLERKDGPLFAETARVREAVAAQRWGMVLSGSQKFPYDLGQHYEVLETVVKGKDPALMPKTGWEARPTRVMVPKAR